MSGESRDTPAGAARAHDYNAGSAQRYAAYRPPLHALLLDQALAGRRFAQGLDVGCGVGWSSVALAAYCDRVIGIDASADMLALAKPHPRIAYLAAAEPPWPVAAESVDVVSFAGVLPNLDREPTLRELRRCRRPDALIIPYDFRICLDPLCARLGAPASSASAGYDHAANLRGAPGVDTLLETADVRRLPATHSESAQLVLSNADRRAAVERQAGAADPLDWVVRRLEQLDWPAEISADVFLAAHRLNGPPA